jgi:GR25 family glycosyltransferase involved in LPS biosynthesis
MKHLIVVLIVTLTVVLIYYAARARLASTHVINMDTSAERLRQFQTGAGRAGLSMTRWRAVNGKALGPNDLLKHSISREIYEKHANKGRLGVIGCYLSHSTLLRHLESMMCGDNDYHVIFEDDAVPPPHFKASLDALIGKLPSDWDILQLYNNQPNTVPWSGAIHKLAVGEGNWGCVAYAVRHGSLRKINAHIAIMRIPIDNQMLEKAHVWKWFCVVPNLVDTDDGGKTTLSDK